LGEKLQCLTEEWEVTFGWSYQGALYMLSVHNNLAVLLWYEQSQIYFARQKKYISTGNVIIQLNMPLAMHH